jgi:hypothetical protein
MEKRGRRGREESSVAFHLLIDIAVAIDVASLVLPSSHSREPQAEAHPVCAASSATSLSPHANNAIADEGFVLSVTPPSPRRVCDLRSAEAQLGKLGIDQPALDLHRLEPDPLSLGRCAAPLPRLLLLALRYARRLTAFLLLVVDKQVLPGRLASELHALTPRSGCEAWFLARSHSTALGHAPVRSHFM